MNVIVGDGIMIAAAALGTPSRVGEILEVRDGDGSRPYLVSRADTGRHQAVPSGAQRSMVRSQVVGNDRENADRLSRGGASRCSYFWPASLDICPAEGMRPRLGRCRRTRRPGRWTRCRRSAGSRP